MPDAVKVGFVPFSTAPRGTLIVFCDDALKFGPATSKALGSAADIIKRAAAANQFKGKSASALEILAPEGLKADRLIVVGTGEAAISRTTISSTSAALLPASFAKARSVTMIAELPAGAMKPEQAAAIAGHPAARLQIRPLQDQEEGRRRTRHARRQSRSRSPTSPRRRRPSRRTMQSSMASSSRAISSTSRRTCSIPKNSPAAQAQLRKLGVEVEILDVKAMTKLGMGALLGVAQGSAEPAAS